jgi:hypothetical protein
MPLVPLPSILLPIIETSTLRIVTRQSANGAPKLKAWL